MGCESGRRDLPFPIWRPARCKLHCRFECRMKGISGCRGRSSSSGCGASPASRHWLMPQGRPIEKGIFCASYRVLWLNWCGMMIVSKAFVGREEMNLYTQIDRYILIHVKTWPHMKDAEIHSESLETAHLRLLLKIMGRWGEPIRISGEIYCLRETGIANWLSYNSWAVCSYSGSAGR